MKECPSCKTKNRNDAHFCAECGADLKDVPAADNELAAAAGSLLGKAKEAAASGAKKAKETAGAFTGGQDFAVNPPVSSSVDGAPQKRRSVLVNPSERIISTIGSSYLQNYLSGDGVRKGIGVLTQKRFYYKGKNFAVNGRQMVSTTEEGVVSIEDITFTMFTYVRHIGLLIFSVLLLLVSTIGFYMPRDGYMIAYPCWIAAAVLVIIFLIKRQTVFQVSFPGGSFGFDIRYYPIRDIRDFQRQLHLLKDRCKENA